MEGFNEKKITANKPDSKIETVADISVGVDKEVKKESDTITYDEKIRRASKDPKELVKEYKKFLNIDLGYIVEDKDKIDDINKKIHSLRSEVMGIVNWIKKYEEREEDTLEEDEVSYFDEVFPNGYNGLGDVIPEDFDGEETVPRMTREIFRVAEGKMELLEDAMNKLESLTDEVTFKKEIEAETEDNNQEINLAA